MYPLGNLQVCFHCGKTSTSWIHFTEEDGVEGDLYICGACGLKAILNALRIEEILGHTPTP
jgi:hypothetical protein